MTDSQSGQEDAKVDCGELRKHILGLFGNHLKSFDIETTEHGLVLNGVCDSFYIKQLAQEVVRKNSRKRIVLNALMVEDQIGFWTDFVEQHQNAFCARLTARSQSFQLNLSSNKLTAKLTRSPRPHAWGPITRATIAELSRKVVIPPSKLGGNLQ